MKVFMVNVLSSRGSTGRICTDVADLLMKNGDECRIAYGRGDVSPAYADISVRISDVLSVAKNTVGARLLDNVGFTGESAAQQLIREIREADPDIIHLHNLHGYYLQCETLFRFLKEEGRPVVWTLHDCWPFTGHCAYYDAAGCTQWKTQCSDCPELRSYPACFGKGNVKENFERKKAAFTSLNDLVLVTPSQWLADQVSESFLKDVPKRVIPNGIDTSAFHPTESDFRQQVLGDKKGIILGVANAWTKRKGYDDFLALQRMLGDSYRFVMVGLTTKQKKELPPEMIGIEHTKDVSELAALYSCADVFVNLTQEDNFPTVNLEAQACGTPVVSYRIGGCNENILQKTELQLTPVGDLTAVRAGIEAVMKDDALRGACREYALQFDKTKKLSAYLTLYRELTE